MPYVECRNLDGTYGHRWEPDPEPVEATQEDVKPPLTRHQQMFIDQLEKNVLLRKMLTAVTPVRTYHNNPFFKVKKYR